VHNTNDARIQARQATFPGRSIEFDCFKVAVSKLDVTQVWGLFGEHQRVVFKECIIDVDLLLRRVTDCNARSENICRQGPILDNIERIDRSFQ